MHGAIHPLPHVFMVWCLVEHRNTVKSRSSCACTLTEHCTMKAYWGSGCIAPRILNLDSRWRRVVSFTPRTLYPQGKSPWCPLGRRLGGSKSRSRRGGEERNFQPLAGLELPIIQPVASAIPLSYIHFNSIFSSTPRPSVRCPLPVF
jgi:hypothetical protein